MNSILFTSASQSDTNLQSIPVCRLSRGNKGETITLAYIYIYSSPLGQSPEAQPQEQLSA